MKKIILAMAVCHLVSGVHSQTDVIALKSHSGDLTNLHQETSSFGLNDITFVDSVIYIGGDCIVEVKSIWNNSRIHDTICNNSYFKEHGYALREVKKYYSESTVFVGFKTESGEAGAFKNREKQNRIPIFVGLVLLSFFGYMFFPALRRK